MEYETNDWFGFDPDQLDSWLERVWTGTQAGTAPTGTTWKVTAAAPSPWLTYPLLRLASPWKGWIEQVWASIERNLRAMRALSTRDADVAEAGQTGARNGVFRELAVDLTKLGWLAAQLAPECRQSVLPFDLMQEILETDCLVLVIQALEVWWQVARVPFLSEAAYAPLSADAAWLGPRLVDSLLELCRHDPVYDDLFRALRARTQAAAEPVTETVAVASCTDTSTDEQSLSGSGLEFTRWESRSSPDSSMEIESVAENAGDRVVPAALEENISAASKSCAWCRTSPLDSASEAGAYRSAFHALRTRPDTEGSSPCLDVLQWASLQDAFAPHWRASIHHERTAPEQRVQACPKASTVNAARGQRRSQRTNLRHWCRFRLEWGLLRLAVRFEAMAVLLSSSGTARVSLEQLLMSEPHFWEDVIDTLRGAFFQTNQRPALANGARNAVSVELHPSVRALVERASLRLLAVAAATWKWEKPLLTSMLHGRGASWLFQAVSTALQTQQETPNDASSSHAERLELYLSTMSRLLRRERRLQHLDGRLQLQLVGLFQKLTGVLGAVAPASLLSLWALQFWTMVFRQTRSDDSFFGMLRHEMAYVQQMLLAQLQYLIGHVSERSAAHREHERYLERIRAYPWAHHDAAEALSETFGTLTLLESTWMRIAWHFLLLRYESQSNGNGTPAAASLIRNASPTLSGTMPAASTTGPTAWLPSERAQATGAHSGPATSGGNATAAAGTPAEPLTLHQPVIRHLLEQVLRHPRLFGGAVWSVATQTLALAMNDDPANAAVFWEEHTIDGLLAVLAAEQSTSMDLPATAEAYIAAWHALDALCIRREQLEALLQPVESTCTELAEVPTAPLGQLRPGPTPSSILGRMLSCLVRVMLYRPALSRARFHSGYDLSFIRGLWKRGPTVQTIFEQVVLSELQSWLRERDQHQALSASTTNDDVDESAAASAGASLEVLVVQRTEELLALDSAMMFCELLRKALLATSRQSAERRVAALTRERLEELQAALWLEALRSLSVPLGLYLLSSNEDRAVPSVRQLIQVTESVRRQALRAGMVIEAARVRAMLGQRLAQALPLVLNQVSPVHCTRIRASSIGSQRASSSSLSTHASRSAQRAPPLFEAILESDWPQTLSLASELGTLLMLLALWGQQLKHKFRLRGMSGGRAAAASAATDTAVGDGTLLQAVGCLERLARFALAQCAFEAVTVYPVALPAKRSLEIEVVMIEQASTAADRTSRLSNATRAVPSRPPQSPPWRSGGTAQAASSPATDTMQWSSERAEQNVTEVFGVARALAIFGVNVRPFYQCVLQESELDITLADVLVGHWAACETLFTGDVWELVQRPTTAHLEPAQCIYLVGLVSSLRALLQESSLPRRTARRLLTVLYARGWPVELFRLVRQLVPPVSLDTCRALDALLDLLVVALLAEDLALGDATPSSERREATAARLAPAGDAVGVETRSRRDSDAATRMTTAAFGMSGGSSAVAATTPPPPTTTTMAAAASPNDAWNAEQATRTSYLALVSVLVRRLLEHDWSQWPRLFVFRLLNLVRLLLAVDASPPAPAPSSLLASGGGAAPPVAGLEAGLRWRSSERAPMHRHPDLLLDSDEALERFVDTYGKGSSFPLRPARIDVLLPWSRRLLRLLQVGHRRQRMPQLDWISFQQQLRKWVREQALHRLFSAPPETLDTALVAECWSLLPPTTWLEDKSLLSSRQMDATGTSRTRPLDEHPLASLVVRAPAVAVHWIARLGFHDSSVSMLRVLAEILEASLDTCPPQDARMPAYLMLYALLLRVITAHSVHEPAAGATQPTGRIAERPSYVTTVPYIPRGVLTAHLPRFLARQALGTLWQYRWKRVRLPTVLEQMLGVIRPLWDWIEAHQVAGAASAEPAQRLALLDLELSALEAVVAAAHAQVRVAAPTPAAVVQAFLRMQRHIDALRAQQQQQQQQQQEQEQQQQQQVAPLVARMLHAWLLLAEYVRIAFYEHDIGLVISAFDRVLREAFRESLSQSGQHQHTVTAASLNPVLERLQALHPMALSVSLMRCLRPVDATRDRRAEPRYQLNSDCPSIETVRVDGNLLTLLMSHEEPGLVWALASCMSTFGAPFATALTRVLRRPSAASYRDWLVRCLAAQAPNMQASVAAGAADPLSAVDWRYLSARALVVQLSAHAGEPQALALELWTEALQRWRDLQAFEGVSVRSEAVLTSTATHERPQSIARLASLTTRLVVHDAHRQMATTGGSNLLLELYGSSFQEPTQANTLLECLYQLAVFYGPGLLQYGPDRTGRYPLLKNGAALEAHRLRELLRSLPSVKSDLFDYAPLLGALGRARLPEPVLDPESMLEPNQELSWSGAALERKRSADTDDAEETISRSPSF